MNGLRGDDRSNDVDGEEDVALGCRHRGTMAFVSDEERLHARALDEPDALAALELWRELAARGNPEAPERLREYADSRDSALREPARETLAELGLSHDEPMP